MAETSPRGPNNNESDKRALSTIRRSGETPRAKLNNRLTGTIPKQVGVTGDHPILPHFHPPREPAALAQQLNERCQQTAPSWRSRSTRSITSCRLQSQTP